MTRVLETRHVLAVKNLGQSTDYYINELGFKREFSADGWEMLHLDDFHVMLGECPQEIPASQTNNHSWFAQVFVDDADALYQQMQDRNARGLAAPADKPWGMREFCVTTVDGHRIIFGHEL